MSAVLKNTLRSTVDFSAAIMNKSWDAGAGFFAPLSADLNLVVGTGSPTVTRASTATVSQHDGSLQTALANEARFYQMQRVQNLWVIQSATLASAANNTITLAAGTYTFSMGAGAGTATFSGTGGATGTLSANSTNRVAKTVTITAGTLIITASVATLIDLQVEAGAFVSDYVSVGVLAAPYHGAGVDGVQYFQTYPSLWAGYSATAQASAASSITLDVTARTTTDIYKGGVISITGGLGAGQTRNVMTSRKNWFVHSKYADTATWNMQNTVTTSGNQVTSTNALDPLIGQANDTGVAVAGRTFTISADLWLDAADGGIPYQFFLYDGGLANVNMSPTFNLSTVRTHYNFSVTFPTGITSSVLVGRLDPQSGFNPGMYFRAENWNVVEGADVPFISTASTPAVGIAIDTPWAIIPDATSVFTLGTVGVVTSTNVGAPLPRAGMGNYLSEGAATNYFLNSSAPVTQTTGSLATGTYTAWITGTGTLTISAGTATITGGGAASAGTPVTFVVTVAGTVVCTVAGGPTTAQVENSLFQTSSIPTAGATAARVVDVDSIPVSGNIIAAQGVIYLEFTPNHAPSGTIYLFGSYVDANNSTAILHDGTNLIFRKRIAGVNYDATIVNAFVSGTTYKMAARWNATSGTQIVLNGMVGTLNANAAAIQLAATMQAGADGNSLGQPTAELGKGRIWQTELPDTTLQALTA